MPKVYNTFGYKAGCIYRMKLTNFVTYKLVEFFPGPSLNMIIGPNGTGKSTFVCALILGLCGNINSIGRAKKISEYVRSGCEEAVIEIELYQEHKEPNVVITRVFTKKDMSKWYIDNKISNLKIVKDLIEKFDIQVNNLCQLLPQDRVTDFAKMDSHTLLHSTLTAVGQKERVEQLDKLKNWRSEQVGLADRLKKNEKKREALIRQNEMLKVRIDALNQRKEIDKEIKVCECKKLWIEEGVLRQQSRRYDEDKKAAGKLVRDQQAKVKPLEESMESVKRQIKELENEKLAINNQINDLKEQADESLRTVKLQNENIKSAQALYLDMEERQRSEGRALTQARLQLEKLQGDKAHALRKYGDEASMKMELAGLEAPIRQLQADRSRLKRQRDEIQYGLECSVFPEMSRCRSKIHQLEDVDKERLRILERVSGDAHKALQWLEGNRGLFRGAVCKPMMLEINFPERKYARYLEGTVARRDLVAFTFERKEDMNLFLQKVRQEMRLKRVNAVLSPSEGGKYSSPDITEICELGFQKYLVDTFTAPAMITRYLCRSYNVHRVPVGNDYTYNHSGEVPANITLFFSESHRFSVRVSAYSGAKSTSISEVRPPVLLAVTVDTDQICRWREQLELLEARQRKHEAEKQGIDQNLAEIENQYAVFAAKRQDITKHSYHIKELLHKIREVEKDVAELESKTCRVELADERRKCVASQREFAGKQVKTHLELAAAVAGAHEWAALKELATLKLKKTRNSIVNQEAALREVKDSLHKAQESLNTIKQLEDRAKQKADAKLSEAKHVSNNRTPRDAQFPFKEIYEKLPSDLEKLEEHHADLMTKIHCMSESDESDLRTFEQNKKQIEELSVDVNSAQNDHKRLENNMKRMKVDWMNCIKQLLTEINMRFSDMFSKLGCGGEVRLKQGATEEDFASYGVQVMVTFREGEPLSELTPHTQSGGERALATAIYLLSLQRLARAPFRCVDEINQGMDSQNERRMFEFLVRVTTEGEQGQYFLLTPKLLKNLEYNENVTVHTIMNGREALRCDEWQIDALIEKARSMPRLP